jgi:hypothetical protein
VEEAMRKSNLESLIDLMGDPQPSSEEDAPTTQSLLPSVQAAASTTRKSDEDTYSRYGSEEALKKALAAKGPGAYVIGVRRLDRAMTMPDAPAGSFKDRKNIELLHEHVFYLDAEGELHDAGFFNHDDETGEKGGVRHDYEKKQGSIGKFHFGPVEEGRVLGKEALEQKGFGPDDYNLIKNNCQDYIDALRRSALVPRPRRRPGV